MMVAPYYFKHRALGALKGNWQTALLVTFFAGIVTTALSVLQSMVMPAIPITLDDAALTRFMNAVLAVPEAAKIAELALALAALLVTPFLSVGANHYALRRLAGEELGFKGLFSRANVFWRAVWLYVQIGVRVFLWSLLLFVPGIIAAIRYSMAPYCLAEHPDMTAGEALRKSKELTKGYKAAYFLLLTSFLGWLLAEMIVETLLVSVSVTVALVASQFMQLAISVYISFSVAAFYEALATEGGMRRVTEDLERRMRAAGVDPSARGGMPFGRRDGSAPDGTEADEPDDDGTDGTDAEASDDAADASVGSAPADPPPREGGE